ncbi:hypothetical protein GGI25_005924 [Coemansia spiralis]|uniref:GATA-type domain-containing protein n=2 Tax=Coemansia TaxID=4863 RepID=A0A9W8KW01_9FUNG|nr:hypothetical protein BX070DRAFT_234730 [Coemansia spiralis]KAJ1987241.1 hypothetical protein EDC05_005939 [Coemansia umbellata]KAJ2619170.1 hypothetical protein GGI26_006044 [Coemansia sp. RSA 1358]KAJ2670204.1 hypothetical protein GGI25_005924 [Coemansia spiralis]
MYTSNSNDATPANPHMGALAQHSLDPMPCENTTTPMVYPFHFSSQQCTYNTASTPTDILSQTSPMQFLPHLQFPMPISPPSSQQSAYCYQTTPPVSQNLATPLLYPPPPVPSQFLGGLPQPSNYLSIQATQIPEPVYGQVMIHDHQQYNITMQQMGISQHYFEQKRIEQEKELELQFHASIVDSKLVDQRPKIKTCSICNASETPTWRRHPKSGACVCNACGLYYKLHTRDREFTRNARGQKVVKRQPRGSAKKALRRTRALALEESTSMHQSHASQPPNPQTVPVNSTRQYNPLQLQQYSFE